ncbi:unnamed protein product [Rotaria sordida]|uniref:Glutathione transferase n=2 Tax=Rotaria sordida TaxID=392033 RepID=A0A814BXE3_9BILA|nr:unnamed protein product [Rotaria sordida]
MPTASMSTYKLYYFNGGGRAEVSRLIFAAAGQKYEDIRYERNEWSSHKSEMPLGQMPVLEVDGTKLPQSLSIARFLAKQFQLAARWEPDETKREELTKKFLAEELPKHLQNLEILGKLYDNGGSFFVGNYLTWADLYFYEIGANMLQLDANCLDNFPWLKQNRAEVEKQPKIAEYLKNRPKTEF